MLGNMSIERIFIVIALIFGIGSVIDLTYALVTLNFELAEILRCVLNIVISGLVFWYFNKKRLLNESKE